MIDGAEKIRVFREVAKEVRDQIEAVKLELEEVTSIPSHGEKHGKLTQLLAEKWTLESDSDRSASEFLLG